MPRVTRKSSGSSVEELLSGGGLGSLEAALDAENEIDPKALIAPLAVGSGSSGLEGPAPIKTSEPTATAKPEPPATANSETATLPGLKKARRKLHPPHKKAASASASEREPDAKLPFQQQSLSFKDIKFQVLEEIPDLIVFARDDKIIGYGVRVKDRWLVKAPFDGLDAAVTIISIMGDKKGDSLWAEKLLEVQSSSKAIKG